MPKFTFIGEHTDLYGNPDGTKVTYEFHVDSINDVLEHTDLFIRGCGYNPSGTLDYISDEDYYGEPHEWHTEEYDTPHVGEMYDSMDLPSNNWPFAAPHPKAPDEWTQTGAGSNVESGGAGNIHSQYYFDAERNK
jgi:hypothetical protein